MAIDSTDHHTDPAPPQTKPLALAALFMFEHSGEGRWRELYLEAVDTLWHCWEYDERVGCHLWVTDLYGAKEKRVMARQGFPGIAFQKRLAPAP